ALTPFARHRDRRGDVVGLGEGLAERLELGQLELAVAALRAPRLGVAETPLPTPQRVGTDAQHRRSRVRTHGAHGERYRAFRSFPQSPQGNLQRGRSRPMVVSRSNRAARWRPGSERRSNAWLNRRSGLQLGSPAKALACDPARAAQLR